MNSRALWHHVLRACTVRHVLPFLNLIKRRTFLPGADKVHCIEMERISPDIIILRWLAMLSVMGAFRMNNISAHACPYIVSCKEQRAHKGHNIHTHTHTLRVMCISQSYTFVTPYAAHGLLKLK